MRLFLDTSVLLAACGSATGASREIFRVAGVNRWVLIATPYVLEETARNFNALPAEAEIVWRELRPRLLVMEDVVTVRQPVVFPVAKDRPILFSALAWADVLLTLDRGDFQTLLGSEFYGLAVLRPGTFLERERAAGRLIS